MSADEKPSPETFRELLNEHKSDMRHLSKVSITFASVYFFTVAGVLALIGEVNSELLLPLVLVLFLISIAGLFIQIKHGLEFHYHARYAALLSCQLDAQAWLTRPFGVQTIFEKRLTNRIYNPLYWLVLIQILGIAGTASLLAVLLGIQEVVPIVLFLVIIIGSIWTYCHVESLTAEVDEEIEYRTGISFRKSS